MPPKARARVAAGLRAYYLRGKTPKPKPKPYAPESKPGPKSQISVRRRSNIEDWLDQKMLTDLEAMVRE